ncbi:hypothetical protein QZH41_010816 [Actinostola sp. cb2023]|nr:hypothetical protein QZH41_010816 [Actinostola sp. cb2023]
MKSRLTKMADYKVAGVGDLSFLVEKTGLSDPALRLVIGLLSAYPLCLIYRLFLYRTNPMLQHVYFIVGGMCLLIFGFGWGVIHSIINIVLVYLVLLIGGPNMGTVITVFILNLVGLAWDYYDGAQDQETLSADFKTTALHKLPSVIEVFGSCYYMGGCLVGPLFPIKPYIQLVEGDLIDKELDNNSCIGAGLKRMVVGLTYLGGYSVLGVWFTASHMNTEEFKALSFISQMWYIGFWGRIILMRYLGVWLTAEGSCIVTGLSYNGKTPQGQLIWDGLRNIKLTIYETSYTYQHIVECFNVNTNKWVFRYVFKRLRFLGNKDLSHFLTLMFLAVWHGLHVGYFICFSLEFLIILMERQVYNLFAGVFKMRWSDMSVPLKALVIAIAWGQSDSVVLGTVFHTTYYIVGTVLALWFALYPTIIHPIYKAVTRTPREQPKDKEK